MPDAAEMACNEEFEVRDLRHKEKFIVEDVYLNGFAKLVGIWATGVYSVLCRHANSETQSCFPSVNTIREKLGISKSQVLKALRALEEYNIIKTEKVSGKHNVYHLLDKKHWRKTGVPQTPVSTRHLTGVPQTPELVSNEHPNDTTKGRKQRKGLSCSRKPKAPADPRVNQIIHYFFEKVQTEKDFKPEIGAKDAARVKALLANAPESILQNAIDFYLDSDKANKVGITLSIALSEHSLNTYRQAWSKSKRHYGNTEEPPTDKKWWSQGPNSGSMEGGYAY